MNFEEACKILRERYTDADQLRAENKRWAHLLQGDFTDDDFNKHKDPEGRGGIIVSRPLVIGSDRKHDTVGIAFPGECDCPTGDYCETIYVLDGMWTAGVDDGEISILRRYGSVLGPANSVLHFWAPKKVIYFGFVETLSNRDI